MSRNDSPRIDVVMCCYNSEKYLEEAINSVLDQTYKNWQLVMINDGSTDSTEEIINTYISSGVPITYHKQSNKGFGFSRQKALELCSNDWVAILDHDDLWYPEKLRIQAETIKNYPILGLLFSNSEQFAGNDRIIRLTLDPNKYDTGIMRDAFQRLFSDGCYIDSETVIISRSALMDVGGFDTFYSYIADYDVFIRIAHKYQVYYDNRIFAKWRVHPNQATQIMTSQIILEHVDLFENVLKRYVLNPDTQNCVRTLLSSYLRSKLSIHLQKGEFENCIKTILRFIRTTPKDPIRYLRITKTVLRGLRTKRILNI